MEGFTFATNNCCSVAVWCCFYNILLRSVSIALSSVAFAIPIARINCLFRFPTVFGFITDKIIYPIFLVENKSVFLTFYSHCFYCMKHCCSPRF